MTDQNIERYTTTVHDNVTRYCPSCGRVRLVWVGVTKAGTRITCCSTCQLTLLIREKEPE